MTRDCCKLVPKIVGKYYVYDQFASKLSSALISGPFDSFKEAEKDRSERNIGEDCVSLRYEKIPD